MAEAATKRVLIISHDIVGKKMGGAGIRYFEMAKELAKHFQVTLAIPNEPEIAHASFKMVRYLNEASFPPLIDDCDYILAQLLEGPNVKYAVEHNKVIMYDFYNSIPIEYLGSLAFSGEKPTAKNDEMFKKLLSDYELFCLSGDFFICSTERQRDFWIGMLTATGALLPTTIKGRTAQELIGIVPFGTPDTKPEHRKPALRGVVPGIEKDDFILLWAGGIWDWFDPLSAIRAMTELTALPKIKLVFMGVTHPNKEVGKMSMADQAIKLAKELGLYNKSVFFVTKWVDYTDRANYLLEANAGISTHFDGVETRFSFRTRILDHIWTNLPSIITKGDWFAEHIEQHKLGLTVEYRDPASIAAAITKLYEQPALIQSIKASLAKVAPTFLWSATTQDLIQAIQTIDGPRAKDPSLVPALDFNSTLIENRHFQDEINGLKRELKSVESDRSRLAQELHRVYSSKKWRWAVKVSETMNRVKGKR